MAVITAKPPVICRACNIPIPTLDIHIVDGFSYHSDCIRCQCCDCPLAKHSSCYVKFNRLYCKTDYKRLFVPKCAKCWQVIQPTDWVRRAKQNVYHLACFVCDMCRRQLSTGEEFIMIADDVICKNHYTEPKVPSPVDDELNDNTTYEDSSDSESKSNHKSKRIRTTFTEEQLKMLQAHFLIDCNPDSSDLERISFQSGLSKRVVQVWFQNSRARQKKFICQPYYGGYYCNINQSTAYYYSSYYHYNNNIDIMQNYSSLNRVNGILIGQTSFNNSSNQLPLSTISHTGTVNKDDNNLQTSSSLESACQHYSSPILAYSQCTNANQPLLLSQASPEGTTSTKRTNSLKRSQLQLCSIPD